MTIIILIISLLLIFILFKSLNLISKKKLSIKGKIKYILISIIYLFSLGFILITLPKIIIILSILIFGPFCIYNTYKNFNIKKFIIIWLYFYTLRTFILLILSFISYFLFNVDFLFNLLTISIFNILFPFPIDIIPWELLYKEQLEHNFIKEENNPFKKGIWFYMQNEPVEPLKTINEWSDIFLQRKLNMEIFGNFNLAEKLPNTVGSLMVTESQFAYLDSIFSDFELVTKPWVVFWEKEGRVYSLPYVNVKHGNSSHLCDVFEESTGFSTKEEARNHLSTWEGTSPRMFIYASNVSKHPREFHACRALTSIFVPKEDVENSLLYIRMTISAMETYVRYNPYNHRHGDRLLWLKWDDWTYIPLNLRSLPSPVRKIVHRNTLDPENFHIFINDIKLLQMNI
jgi:hypothetical protein